MAGSGVTPRDRFRAGLRLGVGFGAAVFVMAVTFGALARSHGWGLLAPVVCSALVFSGSAQFALLAAFTGPGSLVPAVVAVVLISARFLPMGIAAGPSLHGGPLRRAIEGQTVVDASWAAAHRGAGRFDRELMMGATVPQWVLWVAGTAIGVLVAPPDHIMRAFGMDAAFPAFFLVLLLEEAAVSVRARWVAGVGAGVAAGLVTVLPAGLALIGSTVAALTGLRRSMPDSTAHAAHDPARSAPDEGQPREGEPRDGGPRDGGPRDGGPRDGGPREGAPRDGGPREGEPGAGEPRAGESPRGEEAA